MPEVEKAFVLQGLKSLFKNFKKKRKKKNIYIYFSFSPMSWEIRIKNKKLTTNEQSNYHENNPATINVY